MTDVFDADALMESVTHYRAKVGGEVLEFRRYGQMNEAERKLMRPLVEMRERLFHDAALLVKTLEAGEKPERSMTDINEDIHANVVAQLKMACTGTAAQKKKLDALTPEASDALYNDYGKRAELGEA